MRLNGAPGIVGQLIYVVPAEHCSCQHLRWAVSQSPTMAVLYWQQPLQCGTVRLRSSLCWPYIESFGVTIVSPPLLSLGCPKPKIRLDHAWFVGMRFKQQTCIYTEMRRDPKSLQWDHGHWNQLSPNYALLPFGHLLPFKSRIDYWHRQPPAHQKSQRSFL